MEGQRLINKVEPKAKAKILSYLNCLASTWYNVQNYKRIEDWFIWANLKQMNRSYRSCVRLHGLLTTENDTVDLQLFSSEWVLHLFMSLEFSYFHVFSYYKYMLNLIFLQAEANFFFLGAVKSKNGMISSRTDFVTNNKLKCVQFSLVLGYTEMEQCKNFFNSLC